jgi:3-dehydroquinate synthase
VVADRILRLLEEVGFRLWDVALGERTPGGSPAIIAGLREFREHLGGELHITLLSGIGQGFEVTEMDEEAVERAIDELALRSAEPGAQVEPRVAFTAAFGRR